MDKVSWCCKQKGGIKLIEHSENIGKEYLRQSDLDLEEMQNASLKWKNIASYYACYNAFYALLLKIGIKCEIHDCTSELLRFIKGFSPEQIQLLLQLKENRINVQYYLQPPKPVNERAVRDFVLTCKHLFATISYDEIQAIRKTIQSKTK
jgi:uncharacterized protein (UPF0332 family)